MIKRSLIILLILLAASCAIETGDEPEIDYDALLEQGSRALAQGDSLIAHECFELALVARPHDPPASYGLALSDVQQLLNFLDQVIAFAGEYGNQIFAQSTDPDGLDPDGNLDDTAHHFIKHIFEPVLDEMLLALSDAAADSAVTLDLSAFPLALNGTAFANLGGEWDASDLMWLEGVIRLVQGVIDVLQGTSIDMDLGHVFNSPLFDGLMDGETTDPITLVSELIEILLLILGDSDHPDFLLPLPDESWRLERAQLNFAIGAAQWVDVWGRVDAEGDEQYNDVLGYVDKNGNGVRDPSEMYIWCGETPFDPVIMDVMPVLLAIGWELRAALAEGTDLDQSPATVELFDLASFNMLLNAMNLPGLIPATEINLAELFTDPQTEQTKEFLVDALSCLHDEQDAADAVVCLIELVS